MKVVLEVEVELQPSATRGKWSSCVKEAGSDVVLVYFSDYGGKDAKKRVEDLAYQWVANHRLEGEKETNSG